MSCLVIDTGNIKNLLNEGIAESDCILETMPIANRNLFAFKQIWKVNNISLLYSINFEIPLWVWRFPN